MNVLRGMMPGTVLGRWISEGIVWAEVAWDDGSRTSHPLSEIETWKV